ncbi:MAG TPA: hypothetical protein VFA10_04050 [Ktedonobacteraceae bacterium]|nr:hypothetical protein [Ktedonobacteraceae bacterium]
MTYLLRLVARACGTRAGWWMVVLVMWIADLRSAIHITNTTIHQQRFEEKYAIELIKK